jgi:hypothetical protein
LKAWEFKWNPKSKARFPSAFQDAYHPIVTGVVPPEDFRGFWGWSKTTQPLKPHLGQQPVPQ